MTASSVTSTAPTRAASSGGIAAARRRPLPPVPAAAPTAGTPAAPRTSIAPGGGAALSAITRSVGGDERDVCVVSAHVRNRGTFGHGDAQRARQLARTPRRRRSTATARCALRPRRCRRAATARRSRRRAACSTATGSIVCTPSMRTWSTSSNGDSTARKASPSGTTRATIAEQVPQALAAGFALHLDAPLPETRIDRRRHVGDPRGLETDEVELGYESSRPFRRPRRRCTSLDQRVDVVGRRSRIGDEEVGVLLGHDRTPPMRRPLQPLASMSRPAASPGGLVNTEPAFWPPGWCSRRQRTISSMRSAQRGGVVGVPAERRGQTRRRTRRSPNAGSRARDRRGRAHGRCHPRGSKPGRARARRSFRVRGRRRSSGRRRRRFRGSRRRTRGPPRPPLPARRARTGSATAPPACATVPAVDRRRSVRCRRPAGSRSPWNPASATRRFEPRPMTSTGTPVAETVGGHARDVVLVLGAHERRERTAAAVGRELRARCAAAPPGPAARVATLRSSAASVTTCVPRPSQRSGIVVRSPAPSVSTTSPGRARRAGRSSRSRRPATYARSRSG